MDIFKSLFRNAKEKVDELKNALTNGNQRIQEARSKNMKLKEYGMKLMQEKKNLEIQIQQKKATCTSFQNAAFRQNIHTCHCTAGDISEANARDGATLVEWESRNIKSETGIYIEIWPEPDTDNHRQQSESRQNQIDVLTSSSPLEIRENKTIL